MKDFSKKSYNFATLPIGQKLVYSSFLFFMLLGWLTIFVFYIAKSGFSPQSLIDYYIGNESKMMYPKSFLELWEITHFHLFVMPVIFLILIHLLMLTHLDNSIKITLWSAGTLGLIFDMGAPWLVVYAHPSWVGLKILGRFLLNGSFLVMIVYPLFEMGYPPRRQRKRHIRFKSKHETP